MYKPDYVKVCRYYNCKHKSKDIDIRKNNYSKVGNAYYHTDCLQEKTKLRENVEEERKKNIAERNLKRAEKKYREKNIALERKNERIKRDKTKADFQLIKTLWVEELNNTVVYSLLFQVLNDCVNNRNIESDYILFTVQYCISHKFRLKYPPGLRYFLDMEEIKEAYKNKKINENRVDIYSFKTNKEENEPSFKLAKKTKALGSLFEE